MPETDFIVKSLGTAKIPSPINLSTIDGDSVANYVRDDEYIIHDIEAIPGEPRAAYRREELLEKAGPRQKIYFHPGHARAAVITCGGLCPGLNDVIRAIVRCLWLRYGVRRIIGFRNGFAGMLPEYNIPTMDLDPDIVDEIHTKGGTILGSSRGNGTRSEEMVDTLERLNVNIFFVIGGDGTQRAALDISAEIEGRGLKIGVVGIPKTIDNDLSFIQRSFGFETAVSVACDAVASAHVEAKAAINGIGLVKVMGRESGFIAAHTALAINDANFVLIPEIPFDMDGPNGLLAHLERRLERRKHAVILVAEGAGQEILRASSDTDKSGNRKLSDIGTYLRDRISEHLTARKIEHSVKYIDPSYMIRSARAHPNDALYCQRLGSHAAHAGMSGKTEVLISLLNNTFVHLPTHMAVERRNTVDPESPLWRDVIEATDQPISMKNG